MAQRRPIDVAVLKMYIAMIVGSGALLAPITFWIFMTRDQNGMEAPWLNAGLMWSWLIMILLTIPILEYARRRPAGGDLSWGEAMVGSTYVFFLLFWIYGIVPHQWLTYADNELAWRADKFLVGPTPTEGWPLVGDFTNNCSPDALAAGTCKPEGLIDWALPLSIPYLVVRDIIAVTIYVVFLAGNIAMWSIWQNRGKVAPTEVETRYGRPLVREGAGV